MHREQQVADRLGRGALRQQVPERELIAQGLRHLLSLDDQEFGVKPVVHERLPRRSLALGDLVLMMGKDQVGAAAVDVEGLAQVLHAHRRAFDVPAGPAGADFGLPEVLPFLRRLPEREVARVLFVVLVRIDAGARLNAR